MTLPNYDNWLTSNDPANEEDFCDYIDSHYDGLCPVCNTHLDDNQDHYDCGEQWKHDIEIERAEAMAEARAEAMADRYYYR